MMRQFNEIIDRNNSLPVIACPNIIHLIWFGSPLRNTHVSTIKKWRELNSAYQIMLWTDLRLLDDQQSSELSLFCKSQTVILKNIANELATFPDDTDLVQFALELNKSKEGVINFSVPSDFFRLFPLKIYGGWYFDMDVIPNRPLPLNVALPIHFRYYLDVDYFCNVTSQSPCVLLSAPNSTIVCKAISVMQAFWEDLALRNMIEKYGNSPAAHTRNTAVMFSTGSLIEIALLHLTYRGLPCFSMSTGGVSIHPEMYEPLQAFKNRGFYDHKSDNSYVLAENKAPLNGITHYDEYKKISMYGRQGNYEDIEPLRQRMLHYFYDMPTTVLLENNAVLQQRSSNECIQLICSFTELTLEELKTRLNDCKTLQGIAPFKGQSKWIEQLQINFAKAILVILERQSAHNDMSELYREVRNHSCFQNPTTLLNSIFGKSESESQKLIETASKTIEVHKKNNA